MKQEPSTFHFKSDRLELIKEETLNKAIDIAKLSANLKRTIKAKKDAKKLSPIDKLLTSIKRK